MNLLQICGMIDASNSKYSNGGDIASIIEEALPEVQVASYRGGSKIAQRC